MNKWDYKIVGKFNEIFYADLIQKKHMSDSEKYIKTVSTPEDKDSEEKELNTFFYVLNKGHTKYLLQSDSVHDLPIFVTKGERIGYKGEGYSLIQEYDTARFKPEKKMNFRTLVDDFADFKHSSPIDFILYKIINMGALFDRVNVRACTLPGFGKDTAPELIGEVVGDVAIVQKPTIAKLEYLSMNKILMVNELMNLTKQEYRDIEQYLLSVGAFKNNYTKRSRAGSQGKEDYDISKLSVLLMYNTLQDYLDGGVPVEEYFDNTQTNQVKDRFIPFKFKGLITEVFPDISNPEELAKQHTSFFVDYARTMKYFEDNWRKELKPYSELNLGLTGRWKRNFDTITRFINLYSETEEEYKSLSLELYKRHMDYLEMISNSKNLGRFTISLPENDYKGQTVIHVKEEECEVTEEHVL